MNFIILASGKGSRIKRLTKNFPKALIKIKNNLRIIDFINYSLPIKCKKIAVLGYKFNIIKKFFTEKKFILARNNDFHKTNMVESMFVAKKKIVKKDVIVIYSDIIFEKNLIKKLQNTNGNIIPLNINWYKNWKMRMSKKKIFRDAENVVTKQNKILSIGGAIKTKLPKFQFMGIVKFKYKDFLKLHAYYKKIKSKKIDLTSFINSAIQKKVIKMNFISSKYYWTEIDTMNDFKACKKNLKNGLPKNYIKNIQKKL
tara:strand:- start:331 stop:1098 length:768 start_codon:yes stop_codon:yes gene_type:complete